MKDWNIVSDIQAMIHDKNTLMLPRHKDYWKRLIEWRIDNIIIVRTNLTLKYDCVD